MDAVSLTQSTTPVYEHLDEERKQFRLVTIIPSTDANTEICCNLRTVSLHDKPRYEALSYCWGDLSETREIYLEFQSINVTANLHAALAQFRTEQEPLSLWIDAICINQSDLEERGRQAAMMKEIYQNASNVRIWLGPALSTSPREFDLVQRLMGEDFPLTPTIWQSATDFYRQTPDATHDWYDLVRFFRNEYWHRTWTIQERVLASSLTLQSGPLVINLPTIIPLMAKVTVFFSRCLEELRVLALQETRPFEQDREERLEAFKAESRVFIPILGNHTVYRFSTENRVPLPSLLAYIGRTGVTDPRDHVYGTLGLFPELDIVPDYENPLEEVWTDFAIRLMVAEQSFTSLYLPSPSDSTLPSWIPDLGSVVPASTPYPLEGYFTTDRLFDASLKTTFKVAKSEVGSLMVPALIIDHIAPLPSRYQDPMPKDLFDGSQDSLDESYLKSRCLGVTPGNAPGQLRRYKEQDIRLYKAIWRGLAAGVALPEEFTPYFTHLDNVRDIHTPLYTERGRFGSAQTQVGFAVGDVVVVLASLNLPMVLRKVEGFEGAFRVIGPCYLNDVMFGEAVLAAADGDEMGKNNVFEDIHLM